MYTLYSKSYATSTSRAFIDNAGNEYKDFDFAGGVFAKDTAGNHLAARFGLKKPNPFKTQATLSSGSYSPAMGPPPPSFNTSGLSPTLSPTTVATGFERPRSPTTVATGFGDSGFTPTVASTAFGFSPGLTSTMASGFGDGGFGSSSSLSPTTTSTVSSTFGFSPVGFSPGLTSTVASAGFGGLSSTSASATRFNNSGFGFSPGPTFTVPLSVLGTPLGTKFLPKRKPLLQKSLPKRLTKRSKCLPLPKRKDPPPRPPEEWLEIKRAKRQKVTDTPPTPKGLGLVVEGDIISLCEKGNYDVMIHGCNCFHSMGGGLAAQVKRRHHEAHQSDLTTVSGDRTKLGLCSGAEICQNNGHKFFIVNAYTQYRPSSGNGVDIDLHALRDALRNIKEKFAGKRIAYPRIGCGLAGGNWTEISQIIREELAGENHVLVEYKP